MKTPKIIDKQYTDDGASYRIQWPCGMTLWFDLWRDGYGDFTGDWNKYIFFTDNEDDLRERDFQDANNEEAGAYNFADALSLSIEQYENDQIQNTISR